MASWYADGGVSGFAIASNIPEEGLMDLTKEVIKLATNGTVDANGVTRLQYDVPGANFRREISVVARLRLTQADFDARPSGFASSITATMFVADSGEFAAGYVPTPAEILALGDSKVSTFRGRLASTPLVENTAPNPGDYVFIAGGFKPSAGRKYWVLVAPTYRGPGSTGLSNNPPVGNPNVTGRAVSMWANRRPLAPNITAPLGDVSLNAGQTFDLTYTTADPDAFPGGGSQQYTDIAGVQVQYAAKPTAANPNPTWIDLPIATYNTTPAVGAGWYVDRSTLNEPVQANLSGGYYFWAAGSLTVKCGSNVLSPGQGILPSGNWQVRMRTFDYGHPYPNFAAPLASASKALNPASFPETNASPWSRAIVVSVAAQVPPPTPLSPRDNTAIPVDQPVVLAWQYRNTALPPYPQFRRDVDIRKVGDADWTTVTSSESPATTYTLRSTGATTPPYEYFDNGGFENGTAAGWVDANGSTSQITVPNNAAGAHSGSRYLQTTGAGNIIVSRTFNLRDQDLVFTLKGWTYMGPGVSKHSLIIVWLKANGDPVQAASIIDRPAGAGWVQGVIPNLVRPTGATKVQIGLLPTLTAGQTSSAGDRLDDFTMSASTASVDQPYVVSATNHYEWRVRTTDTSGVVSNYSPVARFYVVPALTQGSGQVVPAGSINAATLGCGTHRVFVYRRGGLARVGELTGLSHVDWERVRDDISGAKVIIKDWGIDCGRLLARLETWAYEIVIFRDNGYSVDRVWEGPITLLTYNEGDGEVTVQAKDVGVYFYRRIIKQALNDSRFGGTVVARTAAILRNVFAPDDPNVLEHLRILSDPADAKQYRNLPAWSRTAFEEIDDMAANAGLDYTMVGRSILVWSTKHRIGTLPEFRNEDLGASPIISEYGMSAANLYSVSDGNGVHGEADRLDVSGNDPIYGTIEMLSSSWASDSPEEAGTYTQAGLATVVESFKGFAERSIADRYPPPVVVRVPDNTTLNPGVVISIQHLVPGVVVPLRVSGKLRSLVADQKLDSIKVVEESGNETVKITLSPFSREDTGDDVEAEA